MNTEPRQLHPESLMMSQGYDPFLSEGAVKPPIFMTSTFIFRSAEEGEQYFKWAYGLERRRSDQPMGLIYSRINNPGLQILEERLATWDHGEAALSFASGMAATTTALLATLRPGDVVLYSMPIYGGTEYLLEHILPAFGVETRAFFAGANMAEIEAAAREAGDRLAMFFLETPANPTNLMTDIRAVADLAATRARRPLVFVDNTFLGPVFQRPLDHGADLVIYSATKYIGGHSDVVAGAVVGSRALVDTIFTYRTIMGTVPDPFSCWLLMRSLETLKLRMDAQATSACKIAHALVEHPAVVRVYHPALLAEDDPQRAIYEKQALGPGAVVAFDIAGGKAEAFRFLNAVKLCKLAVSLGGTESLVEHPATMTHSDIPCELRERFGIGDGLVRLSVGVEHPDDILADLFQALEAVV